ncbi:hypothetical protein DFH09DRAFT_1328736 [Mycena vulgaris]|nr:hypothetical protein DFH09DRAFT_1328736 [Mycena vulgaris]
MVEEKRNIVVLSAGANQTTHKSVPTKINDQKHHQLNNPPTILTNQAPINQILGNQILLLNITNQITMSEIHTTIFESPASIRCRFTLWLSFAPAFPNIPAKGAIGPTAGNLPRRKRSSVASLDLPAPVDLRVGRSEYFA